MALTDNSKTPQVQMAQLVPALTGTFTYLVGQITQLAKRVYGSSSDEAIANVAAMGTNADSIFTMAGTFEQAINAVAPLLGKDPIVVMPTGYSYVSNQTDGSGTLTYQAPSSSSSLSSSASA